MRAASDCPLVLAPRTLSLGKRSEASLAVQASRLAELIVTREEEPAGTDPPTLSYNFSSQLFNPGASPSTVTKHSFGSSAGRHSIVPLFPLVYHRQTGPSDPSGLPATVASLSVLDPSSQHPGHCTSLLQRRRTNRGLFILLFSEAQDPDRKYPVSL
jgi:hypothetical protein